MAKKAAPRKTTPFAEVLLNFMWSHRPPWTSGDLRYHLGSVAPNKQTMQNWLYHGHSPSIPVALSVLGKLGIPISELIEAYKRAGVEIPALPEPPAPRHDASPALPPDATALWEQMIDRVIRSMKRSGRFSDADIRAMVADIRSEQLGVDLTDK